MPSLKTKITTQRLADTRAFYESLFGLAVVEEWDDPGDKGVILQFPGGHREALLEIYDGQAAQHFAGLSLQFRVDDVESFAAGLPAGVNFEGPSRRPWGSTYLYLRDPNGIQVIVYEGGW
jgi:catechol 2,3-dioxygenase-like lactoylglutathione lyase family enzyme